MIEDKDRWAGRAEAGAAGDPLPGTAACTVPGAEPRFVVRRFRLVVVDGPARGVTWRSTTDRCSIGSHQRNDLVVDDPTVSRFHCEIRLDEAGARVRDLSSRNRVVLDGVVVVEAFLRADSLLRLGKTVIRFELDAETNALPLSEATRFGSLIGVSTAMRALFAMLARAAASDATLVLEGETGTGKSQAAQAIHDSSARREQPFLTADCSAMVGNLLESELFGHEKGAFTGATSRRIGVFEEAAGGTVFLDEIGELPLDLQPKLLRVLEARQVRRLGSNVHRPVDVRVIAATNRDLRQEVNAGRFRADLYFRLAVLTISMPPLRARPEDIPLLVDEILTSMRASKEDADRVRAPKVLAQIQRSAWLGNVRELRNYLERFLVLRTFSPVPGEAGPAPEGLAVDFTAPYTAERERIVAAFERQYFTAILRAHDGKVANAAAAAGMDRAYFYRLLRRHGIEP